MVNSGSKEELGMEILRLKDELSRIHDFAFVVKSISTAFINMSGDEVNAGITGALKRISDFTGAVRSSVFIVSADGLEIDHTHEWCLTPTHSRIKTLKKIPVGVFGYYQEKILRRQFIIINSIDDLPQKAFKEREWFLRNDSRPLLIVPMVLKKKIFGFLSFSGGSADIWSQELIVLIQIVSDRFTNILYRQKTEQELLNSYKLSEMLINTTNNSAVLLTNGGEVLAINESFASGLGSRGKDAKGKSFFDFFSAKSANFIRTMIAEVVRECKPVRFEDDDGKKILSTAIYPVFDANGNVEKVAIYADDITELKTAEKSIRFLTSTLISTQENERRKIAFDLHDNIAQELACLRINCDAINEKYPEIPSSAKRSISGFSESIKNSIDSVRDLAYELQPPGFDQMGLIKTIYVYCDDFIRKYGIKVDFYSAGIDTVALGFDTENNLHRIIQEALNNIRSHAKAKLVKIRLVATYPTIILRIEDDGAGFDVDYTFHDLKTNRKLGLKSIEGRVRLLDGKLKIISRKNGGTKIFIEIPIRESGSGEKRTEEYYPLFKE